MASLSTEEPNITERKLRYSILSIEALIFLLPSLIIAFIFYKNKIFLGFSQMAIIAFTLVMILAGLIILRQIFDTFYIIAGTIKRTESLVEDRSGEKKEIHNLHEVTASFNRLMVKFEDTTVELKSRLKELFTIRELIEIASRTLDIDELLTVLLGKAMGVLRTEIGSVLMFESENKSFRVIAMKGLKSDPEKKLFININESLMQKIMSEKKPFLVEDIEVHLRISKTESLREGLSLLCLPIFIKDHLMAVLNIGYKGTKELFDSNDEQILSIMIGEVGFALENARLYLNMQENLRELQVRTTELANAHDKLQKEIREREVAEEEKQQLKNQLQMIQRLEAIGTLAGGIAHNFNNLLMGIQGNTSLLLLGIDPTDPNYKRLEHIETLVQNGSKLTQQLLGYARKGKFKVSPIDLNHLVEYMSETFAMAKKEIRFHKKLDKNLFRVVADQSQIEQVLLNLYVNAADAMSESGDIYLETINVTHKDFDGKCYKPKPGKYVMLKVRDKGKGIEEKIMGRIFEPFFTTKGLGSGTGLGLASTYGIIKSHGGYIDVDSEINHGTTFSIYLPASEDKIPDNFETAECIITGSGTVLIVDDEEVVLDSTAMLLKKLGYSVMEAKSGDEAVELIKKNKGKIDMVILDMIMPEMGGKEVYERIKEVDPEMHVLISSGYGIDDLGKDLLKRGCSGFIQKPYNIKELSKQVNEILNRK